MGSLAGPLAYAGQDLRQTLRQMVMDRMTAQKQQQDQALAERRMALEEQDAAQRAKIGDATLASMSAERAAKTQADQQGAVLKDTSALSPGDVIPPQTATSLQSVGLQDYVQHQTPTLPSRADISPVTLPSPQQGASIVGTPRMITNAGNPEQDVYRGTDAQRTEAEQKKAQAAYLSADPTDPSVTSEGKAFLRLRGIVTKGESIPATALPQKPATTGDANYMLNGKPIVALKQNGRLTYQGQDVTDRVTPYVPPAQPTVVLTDQGLQSVNKGTNTATPVTQAGTGAPVTRSNPQIVRQQKAAELAQGDVSSALDQVDEAEKQGLLGPGAGRLYGQFLAGIVGSTGDPAVDARLGGLRAAIKDLNTSYPMAISGTARGGGGGTDRLNSVLNNDKFSADMMRGALHEISGALARRAAPSDGGSANKTVWTRDKNGNLVKQ